MLRIGFILLPAILAPLQAFAAAAGSAVFAKPFWEGKPLLETKLREERAVLVSVRTDKGELDKAADLFTINGVGYVRRDAETVFQLAQQFDHLKEISDVFREVKYDAKTSRVFVICEALGYQARMLIHVEPSKEPVREIRFKVVEGHFLGLEGVLGVKELALVAGAGASGGAAAVASGNVAATANTSGVAGGASSGAPDGASSPLTEVSFRVRHEAREIPIPRVLIGFALEVLVQKVAIKMRSHFEEAARPEPSRSMPEVAPGAARRETGAAVEADVAKPVAGAAEPAVRRKTGAAVEAKVAKPAAVTAPSAARRKSAQGAARRDVVAPETKSAPSAPKSELEK